MSKYKNKKMEIDGHIFHSMAEGNRYNELKLLWNNRLIFNLELQPVYPIELNGKKVCKVLGDFRYVEDGKIVVEDIKGMVTGVSRLKHKLVMAFYPDLDWRIIKV